MPRGIYTITEETRKHMSDAHKGKKLSEENKKNISKALTGRIITEEHRKNLSKALTGRKISDEHRLKSMRNHKGMLGRHHSEETKRKIGGKNLGNPSWCKGLKRPDMSERMIGSKNPFFGKTQIITKAMKEKISKKLMGRPFTEIHKKNLSMALKGNKAHLGKSTSEETKSKISQALRGHKLTDETLKKILKSNNAKPNKQELKLFNHIETLFPKQYQLNVRGEILILGGKIPDIVNVDGRKKLIELYGDYWHRGNDPQQRIDYFKQFGWDTLVIWGRELSDENLLKGKILEFAQQ